MKNIVLILLLGWSAANADSALASQTLFIDRGVFYGVTETSVIKIDVTTGENSIQYADGQVLHWPDRVSARDIERSYDLDVGGGLIWLASKEGARPAKQFRSGPEVSGEFLRSSCSEQARALQEAVDAVDAACSGGGAGSDACAKAQDLLNLAFLNFLECVNRPPDTID